MLGCEGERVHEDVAPDAVFEELLHAHQVRRGERTAPVLALRVHEVDSDDPVLDQVVVKAHPPALVRGQHEVREITVTDHLREVTCVS